MMFAPLEGWRHVEVTDRHAALDYARVLKPDLDSDFGKLMDDQTLASSSAAVSTT